MLWRETYSPIVSREPILTPFGNETFPVIGSLSLGAGREVEVWWRLFEEDFPGSAVEVLPAVLENTAMDLRPPSRHRRIRFEVADLSAIAGSDPARAWCAVVQCGVAQIVVIGPPTEEVWDEVASLWRSVRTLRDAGC